MTRQNETDIFQKFFNENLKYKNIYFDIGACVGELSFPFYNIFNKIYSFEPNIEAIAIFKKNNKYQNIHLIESAVSNSNDKIKFGGFGGSKRFNQAGIRKFDNINEMNTILVNSDSFMNNKIPNPCNLPMPKHNSGDLTEINSMTLEKFIETNNISYENISFIKMDIEGGEKYVIPNIKNILNKYHIPLYLELHTHVLNYNECMDILKILFNIYSKIYDIKFNDAIYNVLDNNIKKGCGTVALFFFD